MGDLGFHSLYNLLTSDYAIAVAVTCRIMSEGAVTCPTIPWPTDIYFLQSHCPTFLNKLRYVLYVTIARLTLARKDDLL
jgi:hypothetical protein